MRSRVSPRQRNLPSTDHYTQYMSIYIYIYVYTVNRSSLVGICVLLGARGEFVRILPAEFVGILPAEFVRMLELKVLSAPATAHTEK